MSDRQALPVVAHELEHWRCRHEGHQSECVEERIRQQIARQFIDGYDYAWAEKIVGPNVGLIAVELDTTVPVVEAYQRSLLREGWSRSA
jgi:hypothetical protein